MSETQVTDKKLIIVDVNAYIFRAFFGIPYMSSSSGTPTNAVFGFTRMLINLIKTQSEHYIAMAFDAKGPTFRHGIYDKYKANRPPTPPELVSQMAIIRNIVSAFNFPIFEISGYEADDIMGTLSKKAENRGLHSILLTGDKDMMQLVCSKTYMLDEFKDKVYKPEDVKEKSGVYPEQIIDYMALTGDASDNIPGVKGIGPKTAAALIGEFETLENIFDNISSIKGAKKQEKLNACRDDAFLSKKLVTIKRDVPLDVDVTSLKPRSPNLESLREIFAELGFSKFLSDIDEIYEQTTKKEKTEYITVSTLDALKAVIQELKTAEIVVLDTETTNKEPIKAELVGISLCTSVGKAYYIPIGHNTVQSYNSQLPCSEVLDLLRPVFESESIKKCGQNIKYDMIVLAKNNVFLKGLYFDTMAASYLINPEKQRHNLGDMALDILGQQMISYHDVVGKGKQEVSFDQVPIDRATEYSGEDAEVTFRLAKHFEPILKKKKLLKRFNDIELPLIYVLTKMELEGIKVDCQVMRGMSLEVDRELARLKDVIYAHSGEVFNIDSPKQLSCILFEKLKLPVIKKTKTGYSTNVDVLEKLALHSELPGKVLEYRVLKKLKSTYIDAIPAMVNPKTNRVHTSFNQTVTATGRLSSSNPNLQNIPVRTEMGRRIRKAFVSDAGKSFISADYSQIELRILAHFSKDQKLLEAFKSGEDVHTITASEIFSIDSQFVTPEMRRKAKVVNFGIVYGMGAYGLSQDLKISLSEASSYIKSYYLAYSGVEEFRKKIIEHAEQSGSVSTLLGHTRKIPELQSKNKNTRSLGERLAINTPIQGTAAELIKLAMININEHILKKSPDIHLLLQIHDELIFELPDSELGWAKEAIKEEMENVFSLDIPLTVNLSSGRNWAELKD